MARSFVDAFVINLIPLLVVAVLLYAVLMGMSTDEEQSDRFGFDMFASLGAVTALLFTVILAHIQLREGFPGTRVFYLEYYYLVMYLLILLVGMNGYLFTFHGGREVLCTYDFGIKLAFWQLLLGILAVVTLAEL